MTIYTVVPRTWPTPAKGLPPRAVVQPTQRREYYLPQQACSVIDLTKHYARDKRVAPTPLALLLLNPFAWRMCFELVDFMRCQEHTKCREGYACKGKILLSYSWQSHDHRKCTLTVHPDNYMTYLIGVAVPDLHGDTFQCPRACLDVQKPQSHLTTLPEHATVNDEWQEGVGNLACATGNGDGYVIFPKEEMWQQWGRSSVACRRGLFVAYRSG